jgi:hypothetical protein
LLGQLFHPVAGFSPSEPGEGAIPLPMGSERIQSLSDAEGQSWIAFRGAGEVAEWKAHFDRAFDGRNWDRLRPWSQTGSGWTAAFQSSEKQEQAEVWLTVNADGVCEGMLLVEPVRANGRRAN